MVPALSIWGQTRQIRANATSLVAIIPISAVGVAVYYYGARQHQADLRFAALMTVGAVVGAYLGARFVDRIPERALKAAVAVLMLLAAIKQLVLPGS